MCNPFRSAATQNVIIHKPTCVRPWILFQPVHEKSDDSTDGLKFRERVCTDSVRIIYMYTYMSRQCCTDAYFVPTCSQTRLQASITSQKRDVAPKTTFTLLLMRHFCQQRQFKESKFVQLYQLCLENVRLKQSDKPKVYSTYSTYIVITR